MRKQQSKFRQPVASDSATQRLPTLKSLFFVLIGGCVFGLAILALFLFLYQREGVKYRRDYEGIMAEIQIGKLRKIVIRPRPSPERLPEQFFVRVGDETKWIGELDRDDLKRLGFDRELGGGMLSKSSNGMHNSDWARISDERLTYLSVMRDEIEFSNSRNGPFLTAGCTLREFETQFGKKFKWHRSRKVNWGI